jgi:hypothetical protein
MNDTFEFFEDSIAWLRQNYASFCFFVERDIVWTLQTHMINQIYEQQLAYRVFNDYPMLPGSRRSLSADLAILSADNGNVDVAVEFKYEPSHKRKDIMPSKFPVVFWGSDGVGKDVQRIQEFVSTGHAKKACSIFIDEGGAFHHRPAHPGSRWIEWRNGIWVLRADTNVQ